MTVILNSIDLQKSIIHDLLKDISKIKTVPKLRIILVGNDPASMTYTANKKKFCEKINARCEILKLDSDVKEAPFLASIKESINDSSVHGCLIQLPLPKHLAHINLGNLLSPEKDVDGFHPSNIQMLYNGDIGDNCLLPCTPKGIVSLLKHYQITLPRKKITIIGRSIIVGRPLSLLLTNYDATVTLCHSKSQNIKQLTKASDIIITAIGIPNFLNEEFLNSRKDQVLIDVGINQYKGNLCGDIDFLSVQDKVAAITPVPKAVGPMTIASLGQNLLQATKKCL